MNPDQDSRTAGSELPARVAAALADCDEQYRQAIALPQHTDTERATRCVRVALACARRAGWWRVLIRWAIRDGGHHALFLEALVIAQENARNDARFWRGSARDWRARAERHDDDARDGGDGPGPWAMWDDGVTGVAS